MAPPPSRPASSRESGQAAVETALVMPLALFLVLGTLQLFMMLQGRILAEYAVYRATRAGSINQADCRVMTHSAVASLLPAITRTDNPMTLAAAFRLRRGNNYVPFVDGNRTGPIVWLVKRMDRPLGSAIQETFDDRMVAESRAELQVDMVFWFPLKIPFANWVMSRMFLAYWGLMPYMSTNPIAPAEENAMWVSDGDNIASNRIANEFRNRNLVLRQYVVPIRTSFRMRMMTPALQNGQACPNSPVAL